MPDILKTLPARITRGFIHSKIIERLSFVGSLFLAILSRKGAEVLGIESR